MCLISSPHCLQEFLKSRNPRRRKTHPFSSPPQYSTHHRYNPFGTQTAALRLLHCSGGSLSEKGETCFLAPGESLAFPIASSQTASRLPSRTAGPLGSELAAAHAACPKPRGAPHLEHIWRQAQPVPPLGEQRASCRPQGVKLLPNLSRGAARRKASVCLTTPDFGAGCGEAKPCLSSHGASGVQRGDTGGFSAGLVPS